MEEKEYLRLNEIMRQNGIKGVWLAEQLATTPQYINAVRYGRKNVSIKMLFRIAEVLGCQPHELISTYKK